MHKSKYTIIEETQICLLIYVTNINKRAVALQIWHLIQEKKNEQMVTEKSLWPFTYLTEQVQDNSLGFILQNRAIVSCLTPVNNPPTDSPVRSCGSGTRGFPECHPSFVWIERSQELYANIGFIKVKIQKLEFLSYATQ